jgi:hypothetical protein
MSYEEVSNLFEGYPYIEVNITTGFNIDQIKERIIEGLHKDAKRKIKQLTKPVRRISLTCESNCFKKILLMTSFILLYSMFIYIGLPLSDFAFTTDKWYCIF